MGVYYILSQAGRKMSLNPSLSSDRDTLLRYLNEGARELYDQSDMIGILMEQVFKVNGDQTISLPYYVGPVRAARQLYGHHAWTISQMRPRYNQIAWKDMWSNLRLRNIQALQYTVTNVSVGVLSVPIIESPPIVITLVGPTDTASNAVEVITMDARTKNTINNFTDYTTVSKDRINAVDVTLSDVDGNVLTVIPNCMTEALYQMLDVSAFPFGTNGTNPQGNYLELLYKKALPTLSNDGDSFPSKTNYDDILVNKMMQLWSEEQNKPDVALAYDSKATRSLARKQEDQNRGTDDMIALARNPHDRLHGRVSGSRRFFAGWWRRRW